MKYICYLDIDENQIRKAKSNLIKIASTQQKYVSLTSGIFDNGFSAALVTFAQTPKTIEFNELQLRDELGRVITSFPMPYKFKPMRKIATFGDDEYTIIVIPANDIPSFSSQDKEKYDNLIHLYPQIKFEQKRQADLEEVIELITGDDDEFFNNLFEQQRR